MLSISDEQLSEQMKLCDQAVQAMRRYREARGVLPEEKVAELREKAEALFAAVQVHMAKSDDSDKK
ncbi:MAG: hypothetical protein ACN6QH_20950 [Pseudomonas sp.]|uniref:hypothetical protein n=1 Tax=Pseudomonas sp. TaxID=306 RepID=UPI003D1507E0